MGWAGPAGRLLALHARLGLPPHSLASSGNSALHLAAMHGHLDVLRLLLQDGSAQPDQTNHNSDTPLLFAASAGHVGVAAALLTVCPPPPPPPHHHPARPFGASRAW